MDLEIIHSALKNAWSKETSYPKDSSEWSPANPSIGQCAVTSLIVNDLLGGEILFSKSYNHFWNLLEDGTHVDLTRDQFADKVVINDSIAVSREAILKGKEAMRARTPERYHLLKNRAEELLFVKLEV
jgi:hypothetical protein